MKGDKVPVVIKVINRDEVKYKWSDEEFAAFLIIILDEQGEDVEDTYKIYRNRSKVPMTFDKIKTFVRPYVIRWVPYEEKLRFSTISKDMHFTGILSLCDNIQVQFNHFDEFTKGIEDAMRITNNLNIREIYDIFRLNGEYEEETKILHKSNKIKANIKRCTTVKSKRKNSYITPRKHKVCEKLIFDRLHIIEKDGKVEILDQAPPKKLKRNLKIKGVNKN